jgi:hypothetical protein
MAGTSEQQLLLTQKIHDDTGLIRIATCTFRNDSGLTHARSGWNPDSKACAGEFTAVSIPHSDPHCTLHSAQCTLHTFPNTPKVYSKNIHQEPDKMHSAHCTMHTHTVVVVVTCDCDTDDRSDEAR